MIKERDVVRAGDEGKVKLKVSEPSKVKICPQVLITEILTLPCRGLADPLTQSQDGGQVHVEAG